MQSKKRIQKIVLFATVFSVGAFAFSGCGKQAESTIDTFHAGWNLGNALDSVEGVTKTSEDFMKDYQGMLVYTTNPYTSWDASPSIMFSDGECQLRWEMNGLTSDPNGQADKLIIQLYNSSLRDSVNSQIKCTVSESKLTTKDGKSIDVNSVNGSYTSGINGTIAENIEMDLASIADIAVTKDLEGAVFETKVTIDEYPINAEYVTPEEYYETLWGNPVTGQGTFQMVSQAGFQTVRIPVTYTNHLLEDGTIDEKWLMRVEELVNYALEQDMNCIIDMHHDVGENARINADPDKLEENKELVKTAWEQIAVYFNKYDSRLVFEGLNETLDSKNDWSCNDEKTFQAMNELNQVFVDTVRSTGGNNENRTLIVNTYAAGCTKEILSNFKLPEDSAKNKLIAGVHVYFTKDDLDPIFKRIDKYLLKKGIPVVIGECGIRHQAGSTDSTLQLEYHNKLTENAKKYGIACFIWDDGHKYESVDQIDTYSLLNRENNSWYFPEVVDTFVGALE